MKRVLHVLRSLERSGMEMMLLNSFSAWSHSGYTCDVLATTAEVGPQAPAMRAAGYGVFHIPFRGSLRYVPRLQFIRAYWRLCSSGYDIVHVQTEAAALLFVVLARLAGVKRVVITPHNTFRFNGLMRARKFMERLIIRLLGGRYGMISDAIMACEWEYYRNPGTRVWNWADTAHFRPSTPEERTDARRSLDIADNVFVIVSLGNCSKVKNHEAILRAVQLLPADLSPLYLHIGKEASENSERRLAAEIGIEDRVRFVGSQANPLQFLWAADVFVMPSLYEGLGMAAVEAIATGIPTVLSAVDGLSEVAKETQETVLTTTESASVAKGVMEIAMLPHEERRKRALADSDRIRRRFSVQNGVRSIVEGLYCPDNKRQSASHGKAQ
jgi:glycosyltransferase involved in cell wall biosynthesis